MDRLTFPPINDVYQSCIDWVKNDQVSKSFDEGSS